MDNGENDMSKASDGLTNVFYYTNKFGKTKKIVVDERTVRAVKINGKTFLLRTIKGVSSFIFPDHGEQPERYHHAFNAFASEDSPLLELVKTDILPQIGLCNKLQQSPRGLSVEIQTPFSYIGGRPVIAVLSRTELDHPFRHHHVLTIDNERRDVTIENTPRTFFDLVSLVLRDCDCQKGLGDK
jgi:hypothetical protein